MTYLTEKLLSKIIFDKWLKDGAHARYKRNIKQWLDQLLDEEEFEEDRQAVLNRCSPEEKQRVLQRIEAKIQNHLLAQNQTETRKKLVNYFFANFQLETWNWNGPEVFSDWATRDASFWVQLGDDSEGNSNGQPGALITVANTVKLEYDIGSGPSTTRTWPLDLQRKKDILAEIEATLVEAFSPLYQD